MGHILDQFETPYVDAQTLLAKLRDYKNPRDWIARMVKNGDLWRLKNGFFLISSRFQRGTGDYPYEQIANLLYGPSYISLEWALSFYHLIPERVAVVTSVTTGSNKEFATQIGTFTYHHLSGSRYSMGMNHVKVEGQLGGFLIASREKALADTLFQSCKDMSEKELLKELVESKRIDEENLKSLDKELMLAIGGQYKSDMIKKLAKVITTL
jgi:predicted transcriptional regulator of viral defense system